MKKIMVTTLTCDDIRKKVDITLINKFQLKKEVEATHSKAQVCICSMKNFNNDRQEK